jgi:apolipoprotein N-acyltransferase
MIAAFPPIDLWPLALLVPVPHALLALRARTTRIALLATLAAQMLMWLWLLRWIIPVTHAGFVMLAAYQSLHVAILIWLLRRVSRSPLFARWPMAILLPLIWTASEYFRGEIAFNGYPWYLLAHPMVEWLTFAQASDLFGAYVVSFLAAIPAGAAIDVVGWMVPALERNVAPLRGGRCPPYMAVPSVLLLVASIGYGQWRLSQRGALVSAGPRILAIQTNLPQDNKIGWTAEQQAIDVPEFMELTRRAFAAVGGRANIDLIVWPETMLPSLGFDGQTIAEVIRFSEMAAASGAERWVRWIDAIETLRRDLGVPMLVGSEAWVNAQVAVDHATATVSLQRDKEFNSAFLLQGSAPFQRYDKVVLTPFGETMPYISNWKWLERQLLALGARGMRFTLDASRHVNVLALQGETERARSRVIGTPICFEDTVAWLCRAMVYQSGRKRADVLVNMSNDGWFGAFDADRKLHGQVARFRCIENRVPMVRCVNTGVTIHIDSTGRVVDAAGEGRYGAAREQGWMLADTAVDPRSTLYGRVGNLFPGACLLLAAGFIGVTLLNRSPIRS